MPGSGQGTSDLHAPEVMGVLAQLKQFFNLVLKWRVMRLSGPMSVGFADIINDGNEHPVDLNATYVVSLFSVRNRSTNSGTIYIGSTGRTFPNGIQLEPGDSVPIPWCYPSEMFYNVQGGATTDVYEIWWGG